MTFPCVWKKALKLLCDVTHNEQTLNTGYREMSFKNQYDVLR